jgi:riboflavin kinase / FMN adenylyltransferase
MTRVLTLGSGMDPLGPAVAAVGVFDGVHVGHQALIRDAVMLARAKDALSVVVTFDRDPDQVVDPAAATAQLLDLDDKLTLLAAQGPDVVLVVTFDQALAAMPSLQFLDEVLLASVTPVAAVVGYDFRFGHRAEGDVDLLVRYGAEHDFTVLAHDLVRVGGAPVTSTRIRSLVATGDVVGAGELLGRPHRLKGLVVPGRHVGRDLGAPTANLEIATYAALPADGVYAASTVIDGAVYPAAVSVGVPPTFPSASAVLEVHVIGFDGDLYGRTLGVEFLERIRDQRRFESAEELATQIAEDIRRTVDVFADPPSHVSAEGDGSTGR